MITSKLYQEGKNIISQIKEFVIKNLGGKAYEEDYYKLNYYMLPKTYMNKAKDRLTQDNIKEVNRLIQLIHNCEAFTKLRRTRSGGISIERSYLHSHPFQYDIISSTSKYILTVVSNEGSIKIQIGYVKEKEHKGNNIGGNASNRIISAVESTGIDFTKYQNSYEEGKKAASEIHKPEVKTVQAIKDVTYEGNIHHLDFHKFYPSGIVILHPELREAFQMLKDKGDKEALDAGTRYLASPYAKFQYAKLIKDGINFMYERFFQVYEDLKKDHKVFAFNTDGIWYQGEVYHNPNLYEGNEFGEWSNDYINVQKIRFASDGCGKYEFITEDGTYIPKVKGLSTYDREVDRSEWEWGDIYKTSIIRLQFNSTTEQFTLIE